MEKQIIGKVEDFFDLKSGNIIEYKENQYYFRPNGAVAYLYETLFDYKKKRSKYRKCCIQRRKLNGCVLLKSINNENIDTEESDKTSNSESFDAEWESRPCIIDCSDCLYPD